LVGVAAVEADVPDGELDRLAAAGVRGVRMAHFEPGDPRAMGGFVPLAAFDALEARLADRGMHLQLFTDSRLLPALAPRIRRSRVPVVIDHMGRAPARLGADHEGIQALAGLMRDGPVWVKLSGIANVSDAGPLDWIETITNADGGIPFVLPTAAGRPHAPWWTPQDDPPSSLLMTAGVAAAAYRLGLGDHPWMDTASDYVWAAIAHLKLSDAYAFRYTIHFLDAVPERARAERELEALAQRMPDDGILRVGQGVEGETLSALDVAPRPDHAGRRLIPDALIDRELDELAAAQQDDGGWTFNWAAWHPAVAFEWRGMVTLNALRTLEAYDRLSVSRR
ncbi:MAG TPA: amidohydrolase family protein, partial [Baekduia sp.]|nr:amidohydrolase family protein [Baekduia sp.]